MTIRQAVAIDIPQIQIVRNLVKENMLTDPSKVTNEDCRDYIENRGRGWVCEIEGKITGFSIISLTDNNVWALFVHPHFERGGQGRKLHDTMMDWYFDKTNETAWLTTSPGTRAEQFYRKAGWMEKGTQGAELRFVMPVEVWKRMDK